ncbi:hypothetical protein CYMTET_8452 [Cymbomonas tetramitiformis]|uniref:Uncharacterized protein n=1 Tax=Cymbomonas tetramitiformis TaxID=36881 RepID=A0AAE0GT02_9CHLO|nr:hypothetical protein CYMTET_8452 [Cymbomonas tetramitiformis]
MAYLATNDDEDRVPECQVNTGSPLRPFQVLLDYTRSLCMLEYIQDGKTCNASGFLIDFNGHLFIASNARAMSDVDVVRLMTARFCHLDGTEGSFKARLDPDHFFHVSSTLDFAMSALSTQDMEGQMEQCTPIVIGSCVHPRVNDSLIHLIHTRGNPLQVSIGRVLRLDPSRLYYTMEASMGASGTVVFNSSLQAVAIHSHGGCAQGSHGVYVGAILQELDGLRSPNSLCLEQNHLTNLSVEASSRLGDRVSAKWSYLHSLDRTLKEFKVRARLIGTSDWMIQRTRLQYAEQRDFDFVVRSSEALKIAPFSRYEVQVCAISTLAASGQEVQEYTKTIVVDSRPEFSPVIFAEQRVSGTPAMEIWCNPLPPELAARTTYFRFTARELPPQGRAAQGSAWTHAGNYGAGSTYLESGQEWTVTVHDQSNKYLYTPLGGLRPDVQYEVRVTLRVGCDPQHFRSKILLVGARPQPRREPEDGPLNTSAVTPTAVSFADLQGDQILFRRQQTCDPTRPAVTYFVNGQERLHNVRITNIEHHIGRISITGALPDGASWGPSRRTQLKPGPDHSTTLQGIRSLFTANAVECSPPEDLQPPTEASQVSFKDHQGDESRFIKEAGSSNVLYFVNGEAKLLDVTITKIDHHIGAIFIKGSLPKGASWGTSRKTQVPLGDGHASTLQRLRDLFELPSLPSPSPRPMADIGALPSTKTP